MIQGLPVIPEDDVLVCQSYNFNDAIFHNERKWQQNTYDIPSSSAATATTTLLSSSSSYFGYVAILRDDIILLEVGRPSSIAIITENNSRFDDNDIIIDECVIDNSLFTLDKTIYSILQREVAPGWDTVTLHNDNDNKRITSTSPWVGLRFHIYDDTINNQNDDCVIWSFCIVFYRGDTVTTSKSDARACHDNYTQQKMWIIQNLVQFTESFRQNDVVWKTGSTFSCQYIFAPAIQQRIQQTTSSMWNHKSKPTDNEFIDEDDTLSLDYEWEEVAENIIKRNTSIAETMSLTIKKEESTTMVPVVPVVYQNHNSKESECSLPFVSDESDDENVSMDNEEDYESSDDDMDESNARLNQYQQSTTPIRAGAFPSNYGKNYGNVDDDDMAYLDRIVASNSIWKSVSSDPCTNILLTVRTTATSQYTTTKMLPLESNNCNITKKDSDTDTDSDNDDNSNGDDDNIPMICLVSGQVDAQHSDLWKRSPKSISKAVALGISSTPTPKSPVVVQSLDKIEEPSSLSPWEHVTNTITKMIGIILQHDKQSSMTNNRNSCDDEPSKDNSNELDNDRKCFWCDSLFSPKVSAIIE